MENDDIALKIFANRTGKNGNLTKLSACGKRDVFFRGQAERSEETK